MKAMIAAVSILLLASITGCSKNEEVKPAEAVLTKFPPPNWKADETGKYPASMTAVISLPAKLYADLGTNDQLAAFINDESRGEGIIVKVGTSNLFFVLVRGITSENSEIKFRYYNAKTSYMYEAKPQLNFLVDDVYGTAQDPKVLDLIQLK